MWSINGWRLLTIMIPTTITAISAACLHIFANLQVMWFNGLFVAASTCNFLITPHELGAKMHPRRSYEFFSVQIECIPVLGSRKSTQRWSLSCLAGFTFWLFIPGNHYKPQNRGWSPALFCALRGILCPEATGRPCPGLSWVGWGGGRGWPPLDGISFPPAPEAGFLANPDRQRVPSGAKSIFGFFLSASLRSEFMGFPRGLLPLKLPTRVFLPFLPGKKKIPRSKGRATVTPNATSAQTLWAVYTFDKFAEPSFLALGLNSSFWAPASQGLDRPHNPETNTARCPFQGWFKKLPFGRVHHRPAFQCSAPSSPPSSDPFLVSLLFYSTVLFKCQSKFVFPVRKHLLLFAFKKKLHVAFMILIPTENLTVSTRKGTNVHTDPARRHSCAFTHPYRRTIAYHKAG